MCARWSAVSAAFLIVTAVGVVPARAQAQSAGSNDEVRSFGQLFTRTLGDFGRLPSTENLEWLTGGAVAALAAHGADADTSRALAGAGALNEPFEAGAWLGGTPVELGSAFAAYGIGRALHNDRVARVGADLVRAQLIAEALALGVKQVARRARPAGSGFSFPSGHTTVTFASAVVLHQHFGWKVGIPAYAVAAYVGASRIQSRRHYLSDVVFGAALGTIAGRTVMVNQRHGFIVSPEARPGGGAVMLSLIHR